MREMEDTSAEATQTARSSATPTSDTLNSCTNSPTSFGSNNYFPSLTWTNDGDSRSRMPNFACAMPPGRSGGSMLSAGSFSMSHDMTSLFNQVRSELVVRRSYPVSIESLEVCPGHTGANLISRTQRTHDRSDCGC